MSDDLPDLIRGPRLDLALVSVAQIVARHAAGGPVPLGYDDPSDVLHPDRSPLNRRCRQVLDDPGANPWLIRLGILRATRQVVGLVNFHDRPDARGMVEIGYRVLPQLRGTGYAREMAETMWACAAARDDVRVLRATFTPDNAGSRAIVEGAGFVHVGEQLDDEDGLELIYELSTAAYRARLGR